MKEALIIFIKNPVRGKVKTRLAKSIGDEKALEVYRDLLEKTREVSKGLRQDVFLYYSDWVEEEDKWDKKHFKKKLQSKGDLGQKLVQASKELSELGYEKIAIIGSDCYDLRQEIIEQAFIQLNENELVLGPANDGGYYLIAFSSFAPELFEEITWSSEKVLKQTLVKAGELNWRTFMLPELIDLDTFEDLKKSAYLSEKWNADDRKN